jgi:hypothetical protein
MSEIVGHQEASAKLFALRSGTGAALIAATALTGATYDIDGGQQLVVRS